MKIIVITSPDYHAGEAELITVALQAGAERVHLRKPSFPREEYKSIIEAIPQELRDRITLHDHFDLAVELGVGGVQLNSRNHNVPEGFFASVSYSCHALDEISEGSDYVTLSPIYDSISKSGYGAGFSVADLRRSLPLIKTEVIAMGGVTPANIMQLWSMGFDGAAALGYVWKDYTVEGVRARVECLVRAAQHAENFTLQYITHRNDKFDDIGGALEALKGGCRWVQLRMKGASDEALLSTAVQLREMCNRYNATFLLDDKVELVKQCGADGVHLGKSDMPPSQAREILGEDYIIGGTANTIADMDNLIAQGVDYIGMGPFRFTTTKQNLSAILGHDGYIKARDRAYERDYSTPIVAIGGITADDVESIMECSVAGIALSGTILNAESPAQKTEDILKIINHE